MENLLLNTRDLGELMDKWARGYYHCGKIGFLSSLDSYRKEEFGQFVIQTDNQSKIFMVSAPIISISIG